MSSKQYERIPATKRYRVRVLFVVDKYVEVHAKNEESALQDARDKAGIPDAPGWDSVSARAVLDRQ